MPNSIADQTNSMATTEPVAVARDDLPSIAPIRTKALAGAAATAAQTGGDESSAPECSTPTSEEQKLKAPLVCPPAPRKPRCNKRKLPAATTTTPVNFYVVTRDLSAVFRSLPPKKGFEWLDDLDLYIQNQFSLEYC